MNLQQITFASLAIGLIIYIALAYWSSKQKVTIKQSNMIQDLSTFGKVEQLEVKNGQFHCLITKGFKNEHPNISKCYGRVCAIAGEKYTQVVKHKINDNHFHLILKTKSHAANN